MHITKLITTLALEPRLQLKNVMMGMTAGIRVLWSQQSPKFSNFSFSHSSSHYDTCTFSFAMCYLLDHFLHRHPGISWHHFFWFSYFICYTSYSIIAYYWLHFQVDLIMGFIMIFMRSLL